MEDVKEKADKSIHRNFTLPESQSDWVDARCRDILPFSTYIQALIRYDQENDLLPRLFSKSSIKGLK